MRTQRDQFTDHQIPLQNQDIILRQQQQRLANHPHSEKSKAPVARRRLAGDISVGNVVHLYSDQNKTRARDHYLVVEVSGSFCTIRRLVGSQRRSTSFRVKYSECYNVSSEAMNCRQHAPNTDADSSGDETPPPQQTPPPQSPPTIPSEISLSATQEAPCDDDLASSNNDPSTFQASPDQEGDSCPSDGDFDASHPTLDTYGAAQPAMMTLLQTLLD